MKIVRIGAALTLLATLFGCTTMSESTGGYTAAPVHRVALSYSLYRPGTEDPAQKAILRA